MGYLAHFFFFNFLAPINIHANIVSLCCNTLHYPTPIPTSPRSITIYMCRQSSCRLGMPLEHLVLLISHLRISPCVMLPSIHCVRCLLLRIILLLSLPALRARKVVLRWRRLRIMCWPAFSNAGQRRLPPVNGSDISS